MTDRLSHLKALNEARTKGPWKVVDSYGDLRKGIRTTADVPYDNNIVWPYIEYEESGVSPCDAAFIASLANNADWLIGCVEALQFYAEEGGNGLLRYGSDSGRKARAALEQKP